MAASRNKKRANERAVQRPQATVAAPPPKRNFLHERWLHYSGEFAFSMLEPVRPLVSALNGTLLTLHAQWEIILAHTILFIFLASLFYAVKSFLPSHLRVIAHRARYYLYGDAAGLTPLSGKEW